MSNHGFHVHGPHDHELEHAAEHDPRSLAGQLAVVTAIIATVGAIFGYMGGLTEAEAGLFKNEAAIKKTEAANQWNYYQAKSGKQNLSELAIKLVPEDLKASFAAEVERYKKEKEAIKVDAEKFEALSRAADERSAETLHQHHRWAQATTLLQVSIALAAIALLTKRRWMVNMMFGVSTVGVLVGIAAWLHY
jgi:hypothetical protein